MNPRLAALKFITRCLALEHAGDGVDALRRQIRSGCVVWENVVELANNHLLAPALWAALQEKGLVEELPADLVAYLQELHGLSRVRNAHLLEQLLEAVGLLNEAGIEPVLLKGAFHLVSTLYTDSGVRIMSDIDLLVAPDKVRSAFEVLQRLGYKPEEEDLDDYPEDHHHCPPLFRPGDYAAIEIHRELMDGYTRILSAEEALADARPVLFDGLSMWVLSPTHRLLHNLLHSQLVDAQYQQGILPLRSLHEVVVESSKSATSPDWASIEQRMGEHRQRPVLRDYLLMAHRLFAMPLPAGQHLSIGGYAHYMRCRGQLAWEWFDIWGARWGRLSGENIRRMYACEDSFFALNRARIHHLWCFAARKYADWRRA